MVEAIEMDERIIMEWEKVVAKELENALESFYGVQALENSTFENKITNIFSIPVYHKNGFACIFESDWKIILDYLKEKKEIAEETKIITHDGEWVK